MVGGAAGAIGGLLLILILSSWINPFGPRMMTHSFGYLQLDYLVDFTNELTDDFLKLLPGVIFYRASLDDFTLGIGGGCFNTQF